MPPRVKINKDDIISTSITLIRKNGVSELNARSIANELSCSTQPIFSNFKSMEDLHEQVTASAHNLYLEFLQNEAKSGKYPKYKAFGMAYIRFAKDEKELFKFLFMRDRKNEDLSPTDDFKASIDIIMKANGFSREKAELMHMEMWSLVHGIGTMLATSFCPLKWEQISNMLTDVYQGLRLKHAGEEDKK